MTQNSKPVTAGTKKSGPNWSGLDIFLCLVSFQFLASGYIQNVELPRAKARHKNDEIEIVPVVLYPMDFQHDCEFLYQLNPLPALGKSWRDFEKDGDWKLSVTVGRWIIMGLTAMRSLKPMTCS
jgi:hypothetical protein